MNVLGFCAPSRPQPARGYSGPRRRLPGPRELLETLQARPCQEARGSQARAAATVVAKVPDICISQPADAQVRAAVSRDVAYVLEFGVQHRAHLSSPRVQPAPFVGVVVNFLEFC